MAGKPGLFNATCSFNANSCTIEPGTTLKFAESTSFNIGDRGETFGILAADGEPGTMITFTSAAPEGFESAGDWDGIWFYDGTGI